MVEPSGAPAAQGPIAGQVRPYAAAAELYRLAGWPGVLPLAPGRKEAPPRGYTGDGPDPDETAVAGWVAGQGSGNIGLRMPPGVIGIDVDDYSKNGHVAAGGATMGERVAAWGLLPATWSSTARGVGPSRINFYRAPAQRYASRIGDAEGGVQIIQRHHRYAVVWPSVHPDGGTYLWYSPDGLPAARVPQPGELPELPAAWVAGLLDGAVGASPAAADDAAGYRMLAAVQADRRDACAELHSALLTAKRELGGAGAGSRHDVATGRVYQLVQLAAVGHPGAGWALDELGRVWADVVGGEDREGEWERMLHTAARKAVTAVGRPAPVGADPCLMFGEITVPAPAPVDDRPEQQQWPPAVGQGMTQEWAEAAEGAAQGPAEEFGPVEPPRTLHPLAVVGTHLFDPPYALDQPLAQAVLERMYPVLRYGFDAGVWLLRGPDVWHPRADLADWAVCLLADLMPTGDPDAEKGTEAYDQAVRRRRFMSAGPAGAIARKMRALVAGGVHPCSLELAGLDRDPHLLWAGGVPWDLRASAEHPAVARVDPATVHLHSAAMAPEVRPTPLWDAFLAAVWPDPELRGWAVRVLSIACTGYSDKALPILIGERDRGKALDVDTPILTPRGWVRMGDLARGDEVFGPDGSPTEVTATSATMHGHECYRVTTSDKRSVVADAEHLWTVRERTPGGRAAWSTRTTAELLAAGLRRGVEHRFYLPKQETLHTEAVALPVDPYVLGLWLGDGTSSAAVLTLGDQDVDELVGNLHAAGVETPRIARNKTAWNVGLSTGAHGDLVRQLRALGVLNNKHIPAQYLLAGTAQRLALLQGLLDTDGYINEDDGRVELCTVREELAYNALYLIRSLGWVTQFSKIDATLNGRVIGDRWRICFTPRQGELPPFRLKRRADRIRAPRASARSIRITSIERVESRPVRCISVARADGQFLAGTDLMVTHNSSVVVLLMSVLGSYAHAADARLLSGADRAHASIIHALMGRRLSFIDEGPRDGKMGQEALKQITGGAPLTGNLMHQNPVTFEPTHTLVLTANDVPTLTDAAIRGRVRFIPCEGDPEQVIAARAVIGHTSGPAWRAEAPGVLARMMSEAARWLADPASGRTESAPAAYRFRAEEEAAEQDVVHGWVAEMCEEYPEGTRARTLFEAFVVWCRTGNVHPSRIPNDTKWGKSLTEQGYPPEHRRDGKYRPLRIRSAAGGGWFPQPVTPGTNSPEAPPQYTSTAPPIGNLKQPVTPVTPVTNPHEARSTVTGVTGCDGLENEPVTNGNRRSEPTKPVTVTGVTGSSSFSHTHTHTGKTTEKLAADPSPVTDDLCQVANMQVTPPVTGVTPTRHTPAQPVTPQETQETTTVRNQPAKTRAAAKRQAERTAKVAALGGPLLALPAVVERAPAAQGGVCRSVGLDEARAVVVEQAAAWCALTVDVETSGYPVGHVLHALRTAQLGGAARAVVFDAADPDQMRVAAGLLAAATVLRAHSAQADLVPLAHAGIVDADDAWRRMDDTVLRAKLADPTQCGSDPALKVLSPALFGAAATVVGADAARKELFKAGGWLTETKVTTPPEKSGWLQVDSRCETMVKYAGSDVLDTAALPYALPAPDPVIHERERTVARITARVSHRGLPLDGEHLRRLHAEHTAARDAAAARVRALGIDNPSSDRQVAAALQEAGVLLPRTKPSQRFPAGQPSVAAGVLERYRAVQGRVGDLVDAVLEHAHHETAVSTFLTPYLAMLPPTGDGRVRPTIYTLEAETGRMSSVRPNAQNLPREGGYRAIYTADKGYALISADLSGIEVRVMAGVSQDPALLRLLADGASMCPARRAGRPHDEKRCGWCLNDLHTLITEQVFGPEWTKADRYVVKPGVFGWAYGGGIATLAEQLRISETVMASIVDVLKALMPGYVAWADGLRNAIRGGLRQFRAYSGRVIHLDPRYPHKAPNFVIQGTAREALVDGLIRWDRTRWGGGVVLPVHDEILAMVPEDEADEASAVLAECLAGELYGVRLPAAAAKPSFAWADAV